MITNPGVLGLSNPTEEASNQFGPETQVAVRMTNVDLVKREEDDQSLQNGVIQSEALRLQLASELDSRITEWKGWNRSEFGILLLYSRSITARRKKDPKWQGLTFYLFPEELLGVQEKHRMDGTPRFKLTLRLNVGKEFDSILSCKHSTLMTMKLSY